MNIMVVNVSNVLGENSLRWLGRVYGEVKKIYCLIRDWGKSRVRSTDRDSPLLHSRFFSTGLHCSIAARLP